MAYLGRKYVNLANFIDFKNTNENELSAMFNEEEKLMRIGLTVENQISKS